MKFTYNSISRRRNYNEIFRKLACLTNNEAFEYDADPDRDWIREFFTEFSLEFLPPRDGANFCEFCEISCLVGGPRCPRARVLLPKALWNIFGDPA